MASNVAAEILDEKTIAKLDLPLENARGLPSKAYTSDAFFELEKERLFRGGWMSVAFSHDISNTGDALPLTVAGVEILIVRDSEANVRAFHNVCRHRASTVLQEPAKGLKALVCPYHCWAYELDGRLNGAPMWDGAGHGKIGSLDARDNALASVRCGEWQDIVFVNVAGDASPLENFVAPLEERWKRFDLGAMQPFAHSERVIDANWKVVMEGLLEVYHEKFIHEALGYRVDRDGQRTWVDIMDGDIMGFEGVLPVGNGDDPGPLPRVPGMPATGPASADIFLLFPSTTINVMDNHVVRTIWTPVSATETRWRAAWYFMPEVFGSDAMQKVCNEIVEFWHVVRKEDLLPQLATQKALTSWDSSPKEVQFSSFWEEIVLYFQRHVVRRLT